MADREIILCGDAAELAHKAAEQWIDLARQAIAKSGQFTVALSGGSTPKALYSLLASPEYRGQVEWPRVHLFWGDERCVPPDHPESNYRMAREALLSRIQIPPENIHRMAGEKDPAAAAIDYENELRAFFPSSHAMPRFDLILLGLGDDGHTASLFPGNPFLTETERLAVAPYVEKLHAYRLTLTLPVINAAAQVSFLVVGKAAIVEALLGQNSNPAQYPAGQVRPANGTLTWFITQDAAGGIVTSL